MITTMIRSRSSRSLAARLAITLGLLASCISGGRDARNENLVARSLAASEPDSASVFNTAQLPASVHSHWAYRPLHRPELPETRNRQWPLSPLDRYILASLEQSQSAPSPQADRPTLARRLSLVLTQLPLPLDTLDEYLADAGPDAVERLADRLLASPHYGERMAQPWLDLARYADTHGYHADTHREMWRWRDWVVESFNRGQRYDEFLTEQLAGDLLPRVTLDQRLATGFLRNHMIIFENGVEDEEYRIEYVMDRVSTFGAVALAQTLACARCHDHKHDPFTQRDFYRLFAHFNNVPERGVDGERGNAIPFITAPTRLQQEKLDQYARRLSDLERSLTDRLERPAPAQAAWEQTHRPGGAPTPTDAWLRLGFDGPLEWTGCRAIGPIARMTGRQGDALLLGGETSFEIDPPVRESREKGWTFAAVVYPTVDSTMTLATRVTSANTPRGWELRIERKRPALLLVGPREGEQRWVRTRGSLSLRKWQAIAVQVAVRGEQAAISILLDGKPLPLDVEPQEVAVKTDEAAAGTIAVIPFGESLRPVGPLRLGKSDLDDESPFRGAIDDVWMFDRPLTGEEIVTLAGGDPLLDWLALPVPRRTAEQTRAIRRRFLTATDPEFRELETQLRELRVERDAFARTLPTAMVMEERPQPRTTSVLNRGRFDSPGDRVVAGAPLWLTPDLAKAPANRLELADWLFRDDHPLTARVAANRFWQWQFGVGLVETPADFGLHGARPTHPALLDWLAVELRAGVSRETRWDVKRFQRLLVTSATFRQQAAPNRAAPGDAADSGTDHRLWNCGPSYRLTAEAIRDQALAASGLLDHRLEGPGVFPYQPAGLWEDLAYDTRQFTAQSYRQSHGADLFRRSLYTFWKRASPPPLFTTFDAPDRETCSAQRLVSSSPLQALALMNEPGLVEAAHALADRAGSRAGWAPRAAIVDAFRQLLARHPTRAELEQLEGLYRDELAAFTRDPAAARDWLNQDANAMKDAAPSAALSARAALACVTHVLLGLEETQCVP